MKWKSTSGLIGTSVNLTALPRAPMYSRKRFEFCVAVIGKRRARKGWERRKENKSFEKSIGGLEENACGAW